MTTKIKRTYQVTIPPTSPAASSRSRDRARNAVMPACRELIHADLTEQPGDETAGDPSDYPTQDEQVEHLSANPPGVRAFGRPGQPKS